MRGAETPGKCAGGTFSVEAGRQPRMLSGAEPSWLDVNEHSRLTDEVLCGCMRQQIVAIPALTPHPTCAMLLAAFSRTSFRAGHLPLQGKAFGKPSFSTLDAKQCEVFRVKSGDDIVNMLNSTLHSPHSTLRKPQLPPPFNCCGAWSVPFGNPRSLQAD